MSDTTTEKPTSGSYQLDPDKTHIRFQTTHLFGLRQVHGEFGLVSGSIRLELQNHTPTLCSGDIVISSASFLTGHRRRDSDVRGHRFLDSGKYPTITAGIDKAVRITSNSYQCTGQLPCGTVDGP